MVTSSLFIHDMVITLSLLSGYTRKLRIGCALGLDGIVRWFVCWIRICAIPLLNKTNLGGPSAPNSCRLGVTSSTLAKPLEIHILKSYGNHDFHDLQFSFQKCSGSMMAASLPRDVMDHFLSRWTPVAFLVLLSPRRHWMSWQLFVDAYLSMTSKSDIKNQMDLNFKHRNRYKEDCTHPYCLTISMTTSSNGLKVVDQTYNIFCYATASGLQNTVDYADRYVRSNGLRFVRG